MVDHIWWKKMGNSHMRFGGASHDATRQKNSDTRWLVIAFMRIRGRTCDGHQGCALTDAFRNYRQLIIRVWWVTRFLCRSSHRKRAERLVSSSSTYLQTIMMIVISRWYLSELNFRYVLRSLSITVRKIDIRRNAGCVREL